MRRRLVSRFVGAEYVSAFGMARSIDRVLGKMPNHAADACGPVLPRKLLQGREGVAVEP
jgi:hypothetical protein